MGMNKSRERNGCIGVEDGYETKKGDDMHGG